jgi:hypothetical protein
MSKRHQSNRRRTYGRRQHELRERQTRVLDSLDQIREIATEAYAGADVAVRELGRPLYGTAFLGAD